MAGMPVEETAAAATSAPAVVLTKRNKKEIMKSYFDFFLKFLVLIP